jgi:uncharacterized protein (DUF1697 family)
VEGGQSGSFAVVATHAAFLRAVNVGKHNRIAMAAVRDAIAGLGYDDVRTHLPTGNIAFRAADDEGVVAERIERALGGLGLKDVDAMVRTRGDLLALDGAVFESHPVEEYRHMAIFTRRPVEIGSALPLEVRGVTFVGTGAALLAVMPRTTARPLNPNAIAETRWQTRATTRWWNVVEDFRRTVLG